MRCSTQNRSFESLVKLRVDVRGCIAAPSLETKCRKIKKISLTFSSSVHRSEKRRGDEITHEADWTPSPTSINLVVEPDTEWIAYNANRRQPARGQGAAYVLSRRDWCTRPRRGSCKIGVPLRESYYQSFWHAFLFHAMTQTLYPVVASS